MKKTILLLGLTLAIFAGITVISSCSNTVKSDKTNSNETKTTIESGSQTAYQCPMLCEGDKTYEKPGNCPECKMSLKKVNIEQATYQCPMKCEGDKTYDKPGNCPECGMKIKEIHLHHDNNSHKHDS